MGANSMPKGGENAEAKNPNSNSNKTIIYGIRRNEARRGINENKFEGSSGKTLRNGRIPELEPPALALPRAGKHTAAEEPEGRPPGRGSRPESQECPPETPNHTKPPGKIEPPNGNQPERSTRTHNTRSSPIATSPKKMKK